MNCKKCGNTITNTELFCSKCGTKTEKHHTQQNNQTSTNQVNSDNTLQNDFTSQFGASASKVKSSKSASHKQESNFQQRNSTVNQKFGASVSKSSNNKGVVDNIKSIFSLDDKNEWMKRYIISVCYFMFSMISFVDHPGVTLLSFFIVNALLFPLILCIYDHFARKLFKKTNYFEDVKNIGGGFATVKLMIKFFFLSFVWTFSFLLGIPALIYLYLLAQKLN
ncbi:zinc ribbon domain-containing protein [Staphylococcus rostri]|uniref:Zinc-ribbon domain-containing protein n=1 Tax=Staphylococcus rostri TaxID=522262 RepID=A0A2K3YPP9_9STAP|nr:zinc ribbon domain-containing protein [Staphylococcus rostri]PNZ27577.1 hypothetical protein CD122_06280 [Staphylococcus rostri]